MNKTYGNTSVSQAKVNVKDLKIWGHPDYWKLICKAWSQDEEWMKSTKALEIEGVGCLVQVTTQQDDIVSEAVTFVPNVKVEEIKDSDGNVVARELVAM